MNKQIQFKIKSIKTKLIFGFIVLFTLLECNLLYANGTEIETVQLMQQKRISLNIQGKPLKEILTELEKVSGLNFIIKDDIQISTLNNLSINVNNSTVEEALNTLLAKTNFTYKIIGDIITIVKKSEQPKQKITLSGVIVDKETRKPVVGATLIVVGTNNGAITDQKGDFSLKAEVGNRVEVSFVGYKSQIETILNEKFMTIAIERTTMEVDDVVVTGYQQISKERSTGSYEILKGEEINRTFSQDIVSRIDGKIAGLMVDKEGKITIRGRGSILSNTDPLFVVDGFPVEGGLSTINPDDIESMTVLKDAAAASIWGVRAANGVIVITTKRGSKDGKTTFDLSYTMSINSVPNLGDLHLMETNDHIDYILEKYERGIANFAAMDYYHSSLEKVSEAYYEGILKYGKTATYDQIAADADFQAKIGRLRKADFQKQFEDNLLRNAFNNRFNIALRGGNEKYDYVLSGVYNSNLFQAVGDEDDDFLINFKNNIQLIDRLKFSIGVNVHYNSAKQNGKVIAEAAREYPFHDLLDEDGNRIQYDMVDKWHARKLEGMGYLPYSYNMMDEQEQNDKQSKRFSARLNAGLNLRIIDGLTAETQFQYERGMEKREELFPVSHPTMRNWINMYTLVNDDGSLNQQLPQGAMYDVANNDFEAWTWRNQVNFNKSFSNDKHIISAILGQEMRMYRTSMNQRIQYGYDPISLTASPIDDNGFYNGDVAPWAYGSELRGPFTQYGSTDNRDISFYLNGSYSYNDKYTVSASGRIDQSNIFGNDSKYKYNMIWSTGLSWKLNNENFLKETGWINLLMLRATIGIGGNVNKQFYPVLMGEYLVDDKTGVSYVSLTNPANKNLKWETSQTLNFGLDANLFNNRLKINIDYYNKKGIDLLGRATLDPTHGFESATMNFASMTNNGVELTLNGDIIRNKAVRWSLGGNISYNNNKITRIDDEGTSVSDFLTPAPSGAGVAVLGKPIDRLYGYNYAGLNENGECLLWDDGKKVLHTDYQKDPAKLVYAGKSVAPWYGGVFTSVDYKNFSLSAQAIFKFGHKFRTPISSTKSVYDIKSNVSDRWRKAGDEKHTDVPVMHKNRNVQWSLDEYYQNANIHIKDAAYLKLSDVTLSYDFSKLFRKSFIKGLKMDLQLRNVCQWNANDTNTDPETIFTEPNYGFMSYGLSQPRTFILNLKATF